MALRRKRKRHSPSSLKDKPLRFLLAPIMVNVKDKQDFMVHYAIKHDCKILIKDVTLRNTHTHTCMYYNIMMLRMSEMREEMNFLLDFDSCFGVIDIKYLVLNKTSITSSSNIFLFFFFIVSSITKMGFLKCF